MKRLRIPPRCYEPPTLVFLATLILFGFHWATSLYRDFPIICADEIGYLGNARYLSGSGTLPFMADAPFYHWGYSVLLIPLFWISQKPSTVYASAILLNAALASSVLPLTYCLLRQVLQVGGRMALGIAVAASLYPSFMVHVNFAWAENLFAPVFLLFLLSIFSMVERFRVAAAVSVGLSGGFLFTIHPRGLGVVPVTLLLLLYLYFRGELRGIACFAGFGSLVAAFTITILVNRHLIAVGWGRPEGDLVSTIAKISDPANVAPIFFSGLGQLWYLNTASLGLVFFGGCSVILTVWRACRSAGVAKLGSQSISLLAFTLSSAAILFASAVNMAGWYRADHPIYGRYNEGFLVFWMALGLSFLVNKGNPFKLRITILASYAVALTLISIVVFHPIKALGTGNLGGYAWQNIPGAFLLFKCFGGLDSILLVSGVVILAAAILVWLTRFSERLAVAVCACFFFAGSLSVDSWAEGFDQTYRERSILGLWLQPHLEQSGDVAYDWEIYSPDTFYRFQYLLPMLRFSVLGGRDRPLPSDTDFVFSDADWRAATKVDQHFVTSDPFSRMVIWAIGEEEQWLKNIHLGGICKRLGARTVPGVLEKGFLAQQGGADHQFRWTNGHAILQAFVPSEQVCSLSVDFAVLNPMGTELKLLWNNEVLFEGKLNRGAWSRSFSVLDRRHNDTVKLEILSNTWRPGAKDKRVLGVIVRGVVLNPCNPC